MNFKEYRKLILSSSGTNKLIAAKWLEEQITTFEIGTNKIIKAIDLFYLNNTSKDFNDKHKLDFTFIYMMPPAHIFKKLKAKTLIKIHNTIINKDEPDPNQLDFWFWQNLEETQYAAIESAYKDDINILQSEYCKNIKIRNNHFLEFINTFKIHRWPNSWSVWWPNVSPHTVTDEDLLMLLPQDRITFFEMYRIIQKEPGYYLEGPGWKKINFKLKNKDLIFTACMFLDPEKTTKILEYLKIHE